MAMNVISKRPTMTDVEDDHKPFAHQVVGLYNVIKTVPSEGLGRIDYSELSNLEYESVTYFSSQIETMRSNMRA